MNTITATLALIAIFVLTAAAAPRILTTKSQSPVTRTQPLLPATKPLQQVSISFYDFSIEFPGRATINLYDDSRARTATVTLGEDMVDKQFLYSIASPSGEQEWVRVKWEIGATIKYQIMSSAGGSVTIRLTKDITQSKLKNGRIPIKALAILSEGSNTELQMSDLIGTPGLRRSMLDGAESEEGYGFRESPISQEENKRIFVTPLLGLLRVVLKEFGSLQALSSSERGSTGPRIVQPILGDSGSAGCQVSCVRLTLLTPIYACDDGFWNGCYCPVSIGIWVISECGIYIRCSVSCSSFFPV